MKRNTNLFLAIANHIEKHPEKHDQSIWAATGDDVKGCATAACIAGWAVLLAKPEWIKPKPEYAADDWYEFDLDEERVRTEVPHIGFPGWLEVGTHLLGITEYEANILFDGHAEPEEGTWPEALRALAADHTVEDVIGR